MIIGFLALYTLLSAAQQGVLTWLLRAYVPPSRQGLVNLALHVGGGLLYGLLLAGVLALGPAPTPAGAARLLGQAALVRLLLFDPVLNLGRALLDRRAGQPATALFTVGTSAATDRALRWLAPRLALTPSRLRLLLWLAGALGALAWAVWG
jgi:hypothetical protein